MILRGAVGRFAGVDPVAASGAFGLLAGALSILWPAFAGFAFALSTLTWAGAAGRWSRGALGAVSRPAAAVLLGALPVGAWVAYWAGPAPFPAVRGLVVGAALLPLATWARHAAPGPESA